MYPTPAPVLCPSISISITVLSGRAVVAYTQSASFRVHSIVPAPEWEHAPGRRDEESKEGGSGADRNA